MLNYLWSLLICLMPKIGKVCYAIKCALIKRIF